MSRIPCQQCGEPESGVWHQLSHMSVGQRMGYLRAQVRERPMMSPSDACDVASVVGHTNLPR